MAVENAIWGAERIQGELLKLSIRISKRTVQKYLGRFRTPAPSSQTWATFLKNHASDIWACDFVQTYDLIFRSIFVFVVIEHSSRRIVHVASTYHPTDAWVAQQLREATPWNQKPRYLIRDNDGKYGPRFSAVAKATGIKEITTSVRAPDMNAICERFVGTLRRECLDHILVLNQRHLDRVTKDFVHFYNIARPHQGINQRVPVWPQFQRSSGRIFKMPVLGGLHHDYRRAAWLKGRRMA
mgnify:FL=1